MKKITLKLGSLLVALLFVFVAVPVFAEEIVEDTQVGEEDIADEDVPFKITPEDLTPSITIETDFLDVADSDERLSLWEYDFATGNDTNIWVEKQAFEETMLTVGYNPQGEEPLFGTDMIIGEDDREEVLNKDQFPYSSIGAINVRSNLWRPLAGNRLYDFAERDADRRPHCLLDAT